MWSLCQCSEPSGKRWNGSYSSWNNSSVLGKLGWWKLKTFSKSHNTLFSLFQKYSIQVLSLWNQRTLTGLHYAPHSLFLTGQVNSTVSNFCKSHCSSNLLLPDRRDIPPKSRFSTRVLVGIWASPQWYITLLYCCYYRGFKRTLGKWWLMTPPPPRVWNESDTTPGSGGNRRRLWIRRRGS